MARLLFAASFFFAIAASPAGAQSADADSPAARGEYLFRVSGCGHCHSADDGEALGGGRALETPFGTFYTPNISAHKSAGIGGWSAQDFRRALRQGQSPKGDDYYPAFPFTSYTGMLDEDADALFAYILAQPPSAQANREHDLAWYVDWRFAAKAWKWLFFEPREFTPRPERDAAWNRGAYIATALAHCGECHTPRSIFGALRPELAYAGNAHGPDDELVPNITPHLETGIGDWSRASLEEFLKYGELPNGEYTAGSMDPVIEGIRHMDDADRAALIDFLRALPPIDNRVRN